MSATRKLKPAQPDSSDAPKWDVAATLPYAVIGKPWSARFKKATSPNTADTITYRLTSAPSWLSFDPSTRTISGTPTNAGCQRVKLTAFNGVASAERQLSFVVVSPVERFGHVDADTDEWIGLPQESCTADVVLDKAKPDDKTRVTKVKNGAITLYTEGRIDQAMLAAAVRFVDDWSQGGTSRPLRASEARFLGVQMSGPGSADGIPVSQIDASSRYREACQAVGSKGTERLETFCCLGASFSAAEKLLGAKRSELAAWLVSDIERLTEHYGEIDNSKNKKPWNLGRRGGR